MVVDVFSSPPTEEDGRVASSLPVEPRPVRIEPGTFAMGKPDTSEADPEIDALLHPEFDQALAASLGSNSFQQSLVEALGLPTENEFVRPSQPVRISRAFEIWNVPLTQRQYRDLMDANPSTFADDDRHPVDSVSWFDAIRCCNAMSARDGLEPAYVIEPGGDDDDDAVVTWKGPSAEGWRLPTEAEWEYACRAGSDSARHGALDEVAWFVGNSNERTHPVGLRRPNDWGLYDMLGNVMEWCWNWHGNGLDDSEKLRWNAAGEVELGFGRHKGRSLGEVVVEDPAYLRFVLGEVDIYPDDVRQLISDALEGRIPRCPARYEDPLGPKKGFARVTRGGCYANSPDNVDSNRRSEFDPSWRIDTIGFRPVRTLPG